MSDSKDEFLWWKHGVIYQIYPRSFSDGNADGVGDLEGIRRKLGYLRELGVDGLWLSPIFPSPMKDFSYDVMDYCAIDPLFGNMDTFDRLLREAHALGIRIILDLVMNHSSDRHPWFREALSGRTNAKREWYIWHPGRSRFGRRRPPNNWMAAFGGRAWEWDEKSREYYLHLFLKEQPDLNWRNPEVERAMFDQARFWLEKGVDGFRLDVINYIVKDRELKSNPYRLHPAPPRRHDQQHHRHDRNQPETHDILKRFRSLLDEYPERMLVGEIYPDEGVLEPETSASYQGGGEDELHLAFDFSPMFAQFSARKFRRLLERWYHAAGEHRWPSHVLSNHDQSRAMSRLAGGSVEKARLLAAMLLTQRGTPFLYYGEEIGMSDGLIRRRDIRDPLGQRYWPFHRGRDRSRTPMQWQPGPGLGFTEACHPWLPYSTEDPGTTVAAQKNEAGSLFNWYRQLIELRKREPCLHRGKILFVDSHRDVLAYIREYRGRQIAIALNFSHRSRPLPEAWHDLPSLIDPPTHSGAGAPGEARQAGSNLGSYEAAFLEIAGAIQ
jgi:alpha-glucosidase